MTKHLHKLKAHARLFHVQKEAAFALILIVLTFVLLAALPDTRQPFASSEVQFTDSSASGLAIVPASCPSTPDYAGECDPSPLCNLPSAIAAFFGVDCPEPPPTCSNGASDYPTCTPPTCQNGASNYPTCTFTTNTCQNGASNYPTCTFPPNTCQNGASNYPTCTFTTNTCQNGASNYPTCTLTTNTCQNGASNYPTCTFPEDTPLTCTPLYYCSGSNLYHRSANCQNAFVDSCAFGCDQGECSPAPAPDVVLWQVRPTLVRSGEHVNVSWDTQNVKWCTVSGTNPPGDSWSGHSGAELSGPITGSTVYTLSCTGLDNSPVTRSTTVNIIPFWVED